MDGGVRGKWEVEGGEVESGDGRELEEKRIKENEIFCMLFKYNKLYVKSNYFWLEIYESTQLNYKKDWDLKINIPFINYVNQESWISTGWNQKKSK